MNKNQPKNFNEGDIKSPNKFLKKIPGDIYEQITPDDPTDNYFNFAFSILLRSRTQKSTSIDIILRNEILLACISSFLSLEAAINRLFFDTFERDDEFRREIKSTIPSSVVKYIKESWDNMSVRNKYILLPPLISYYEFDISKMPFSLFDEFRRFRNRLVHSKMHITSFTIEVTDVDENSISGNVLEHSTNAPDSISTFPITGFSTSFRDLSVKDAEKSFEIAYRMRMELFFQCNGSLPHLLYKSNKGELKYEIGDSIAKHIIPSFGEF